MAFLSHDGLPYTVLVIGGGCRARSMKMFETMHRYGLNSVVVGEPDSWTAELEQAGIIHKRLVVPGLSSLPQDSELAHRVLEAVLDASLGQMHGVYNAYNKFLLLSSLVAESLQVVTNSYDSVKRCVFKDQTRACLISSTLESWATCSITSTAEMKEAAAHMKYPAVLKPAKGSGSVAVVKVESAHEALEEFAKIKQLPWAESDTVVFILEEYIDGPEFGLELVIEAGHVVFSTIMDAAKQTSGIYFQGTGRSCPSNESLEVQTMVVSHCIAAAKAVGLTTGVIDMDVRYSQNGPRLLEINARMGGGSVSFMHRVMYNIDLMEVHLKTILGISVAHIGSSMPPDSEQYYEAGWVMSPHSGEVHNMDLFINGIMSMIHSHPNIVSIEPLVQDGACVSGYEKHGLPTSLIQVVTKGSSKVIAAQCLEMTLSTAKANITQLVPNTMSPSCDVPPVNIMSVLQAAAHVQSVLAGAVEIAVRFPTPGVQPTEEATPLRSTPTT